MDIDYYRNQYVEIIQAEKELHQKKLELFDAVKDLAKYKPGDRVAWKGTPGIVRSVKAKEPSWRNEVLCVGYKVRKLTKSGEIHKTQDISYWLIPEEELSDG